MKKPFSLLRHLALLAIATVLLDGEHHSFSAQGPQSRQGAISEAKESATTATRDEAEPEAGQEQLRVYLDPVTGRITRRSAAAPLRLSAPERSFLNRSTVGLQPRRLPNGALALDLQGRFRHLLVATGSQPDELSMNCVQTTEQVDACLQTGVEGAGPSEHKGRDVR